jgi:hypothetical protein
MITTCGPPGTRTPNLWIKSLVRTGYLGAMIFVRTHGRTSAGVRRRPGWSGTPMWVRRRHDRAPKPGSVEMGVCPTMLVNIRATTEQPSCITCSSGGGSRTISLVGAATQPWLNEVRYWGGRRIPAHRAAVPRPSASAAQLLGAGGAVLALPAADHRLHRGDLIGPEPFAGHIRSESHDATPGPR